jgi:hypothetical protein
MKKNLFICSSNFTILNSINTVINNSVFKNSESDLIIFHRTDDMKSLSSKIKKTNIFKNVFDFPFIEKKNIFFFIYTILFPKKFIRNNIFKNKSKELIKNKYDTIISQNMLYISIFRGLSKAKLFLIDEGLSSYTSRTINPKKRSVYFHIANKILFKNKLKHENISYLLYEPKISFSKNNQILELSKINYKNNLLFNNLFNYKINNLYKYNKFIYLGVPIYGLKDLMINLKNTPKNFEEKSKSLISKLFKSLKYNKLIYRPHPIENIEIDKNNDNFIIDNYKNMWEIECQNQIRNDHILISFFSTACFTPKLLFDKEPYVIIIYKILNFKFFNADKLLDRLKSIYSDPDKIIIIKDISELYKTIQKLESLSIIDNKNK